MKYYRELLLVISSAIGTLVLGDLTLTHYFPLSSVRDVRHLPWIERQLKFGNFELDSRLGFRPRLNSKRANRFGAVTNEYNDIPRPGVKRLLFIGDSVTHQAHLIRGLRHCLGEENYEYWNGGVGSYNLEQVVRYYQIFLADVNPDHVIYTFHLNDWENTPTLFVSFDGSIHAFESGYPEFNINKFLYLHSNLYHLYLGHLIGSRRRSELSYRTAAELISTLQEKLTSEKFTVLINPVALPFNKWSDFERRKHEQTIALLESQRIHHYNLAPWLIEAEALKIPIDGKDRSHPGPIISAFLARKLCDSGFATRIHQ